ncbi:MAG: glycosyltransferase family 2 protein [Chitinispirillaceae bacterium]|nr:glycosyltransferase family 2 protein [Chitinispirillaceae bacterium]
MGNDVAVSIVLPVHNEAPCIEGLIREIVEVVTMFTGKVSEIIVIDDVSDDGSAAIVEKIAGKIDRHRTVAPPLHGGGLRLVKLAVRSGQSRALITGFSAARGSLIVSMDADGQYDPGDIPRLIDKMREFDMVCGIRRSRSDGFLRKACSVVANGFRNIVTGDSVADAGCTFRVMRKECIPSLLPFDGKLAGCEFFFHPLMVRKKGFRVGEIEVAHRPRASGKSNYRLMRGRFLRGVRACIRARKMLYSASPAEKSVVL